MASKLLLLKDVQDLGRSGDVVSVRPGFARNFLVPQNLAVFALPNALRMQEKLQEERKKIAEEDRKNSDSIAKQIEGQTVETTVKVDQEGHMYGSVTTIDLMRLITEQIDITLEKKSIQLKHPIKEIGVHSIEVKLKEDVTATFTLKVISETAQVETPIVEEQPAEAELETSPEE